MTAAILVLVIGLAIFWLVFFKLKRLRLTPAWGFGFALIFVHFFLIFLIGLRFVTPTPRTPRSCSTPFSSFHACPSLPS